jgi:hypothetical protein
MKTVIQPIGDADKDSSAVYAALDDRHADWSKAVVAMLNRGAIEFTGEQRSNGSSSYKALKSGLMRR